MSNISYPRYKLPDNISVTSVTGSAGFSGRLYGTASYALNAATINNLSDTAFAKLATNNSYNGNQTVTGYVSASAGITGSLKGNGSQVTNITASNINNFGADVRNVFLAGSGINISGTGNGPYTISTAGGTSETTTNTVTSITASAEFFLLCSGTVTGSVINVQLPLISDIGNGKNYVIKNSGPGIINIYASGSNKIDGAISASLFTTYSSYSLFGTGSNWWIY